MQLFNVCLTFGLALFLTWLASLAPRKVLGYPVLPMNNDPPSVLGPLLKCPPNSEPCLDPLKVCTRVTEENTVFIGDIPVPVGDWCLPRDKPGNCGTLTGKQVWTADGWRCICLYPDIAGGYDCSSPVACDCGGDVDCKNTLADEGGHIYDGVGNAYNADLQCSCTKGIADTAMLDADPLKCHQDPCTPDGRAPGIFREGKCQCQELFWIESNVNFKCNKPATNCNWNYETKECNCGTGEYPVHCQSNLYTRPSYVTERCDGNAAGCVCKDPCSGYCKNNSITTVTENPDKPGTYSCTCSCVASGDKCFKGARCDEWCYRSNDDISYGNSDLCCGGVYEVCDRYSAATDACLSHHYECTSSDC